MNARLFASIAMAVVAMASCDDTTDTLGNSLTSEGDSFEVLSDTFFVTTQSMVVDSVLSRGQYSYLGRMRDPETSTYVTSSYTTQFTILEMLSGSLYLPKLDSIASLENGEVIADSCRMNIYFYSSIGDSLNAMRLTVMEMSTPVEEGRFYYTNFDPEASGMIRSDGRGIMKNKMYTTLDLNLSDSARADIVDKTNMESVTILLNDKYYDLQGNEYNNYGTYLLRKYYENQDNYRNSYNFIHNVCPGFYIKLTDGIGVMSEVYMTELILFFRYYEDGEIVDGYNRMSGTEEVMQTTHIDTDKERLKDLASDNSCTYIKAPAGIFTEVTLPVDEIKYGHENDTISSAKVVFSCMNQSDDEAYDAPDYILMLPKDSLYSFFENKNTPDNVTSFLASHSSSYNTYTFNNISNLIAAMYEAKGNGQSEDWNKAVLVPVSVTTSSTSSSSSSTITNVSNEMSLKSAKLVGGSDNPRQPITISVIYNRISGDD